MREAQDNRVLDLEELENLNEAMTDFLLAGYLMGAGMDPEDWEMVDLIEKESKGRLAQIEAIRASRGYSRHIAIVGRCSNG